MPCCWGQALVGSLEGGHCAEEIPVQRLSQLALLAASPWARSAVVRRAWQAWPSHWLRIPNRIEGKTGPGPCRRIDIERRFFLQQRFLVPGWFVWHRSSCRTWHWRSADCCIVNNSLSAIDEKGCGRWLRSRIAAAGEALKMCQPDHALRRNALSAPVAVMALKSTFYLSGALAAAQWIAALALMCK